MKTITEAETTTTSKAVANNIPDIKTVPLKAPALQTQLKIGKPNDEYEQEADRVADRVMSMPESSVQQQPIEEEEEEVMPKLQMQEEEEEEMMPKLQMQPLEEEEEMLQTKPTLQLQPLEEEEMLQTKPMLQLQPLEEEEDLLQPKWIQKQSCESCSEKEPPEVQASSLGLQTSPLNHIESCGGQSLSDSNRNFFEPRFGHSFSSVKVHTCDSAVQMNQQLGAQAFTYGNNIFFNKGKYSPGSSDGNKLLAHELTHVVQQSSGKKLQKKKRIQLQKKKPEWKKAEEKFKAVVVSLDPKKPKSNSEKLKAGVEKTLGTLGKKKVRDSLFKKLKLNPKGKQILSIIGMGSYGLYALSKKKIPTLNLEFKLKPKTWLTVTTGGDFKKPKVMVGLKWKF